MKNILLGTLVLFMTIPVLAQDKTPVGKSFGRTHFEGGVTFGTSGEMFTFSPSALQYWSIGKRNKKYKIGFGARMTNSFGASSLEYITAPARLTSDMRGPGVLFASNVEENIDTLKLDDTQINALNLFLALRYDFNKKFGVEFNIDLIGVSFGTQKESTLRYDDGQTLITKAYPTTGNILLISDNDKGSLNSELMFSYLHKKHLRFKAGAVFLFNEYTVNNPVVYNNSVGKLIDTDRYRNKSLQFGLGFNYVFNYFKPLKFKMK